MAFFITDNPIALFIALVLTVAVFKVFLGRRKWFQGGNSAYITPVLILTIVLLVAYQPLLKMISFGVPFFILIVIFLFATAAIMFSMGMKEKSIWPAMQKVGILKTALKIFVVCIVLFAISHAWGDKLLEDKSVSITDPLIKEQEAKEIDFSPMFTRQALGMIMIIVVLGFAFFFVNMSA